MSLHLRPDLEDRLQGLAAAAGLSLEAFLQRVVEERTGGAAPSRLSAEEWSRQFEKWADSFPSAPPIPDEALSRENLYPDRW
jgi:hypothetical protein